MSLLSPEIILRHVKNEYRNNLLENDQPWPTTLASRPGHMQISGKSRLFPNIRGLV